MYHTICQRLTNSLVGRRVIIALHTLQSEWTLKVYCQFCKNPTEEVIQIIFPSTIIRYAVAIAHVAHQVGLVYIVHSEIREAFTHRESFSEHEQTSKSKSLLACGSIFCISTKLSKKLLVIQLVEGVANVSILKLISIVLQRGHINVIHRMILYDIAIITILIGIANHRFHFAFLAMVVTFKVSLKGSFIYIAIDVHGFQSVRYLWHLYHDKLHLLAIIDYLHILIFQNASAYLVAIYCIPKVLFDLLWIIHSLNMKSIIPIHCHQVLFHAKDYDTSIGVGKS